MKFFSNSLSSLLPVTEKSSTSGTNSSSQSGDLPILAPPPRRSSSIASASRRASQKSYSSITTSASKPRNLFIVTTRNPVCPLCGTATQLPIGGATRLPKHTVLNRLVDTYASLHGIPQENCENCESTDNPAINHCKECLVNLCEGCSEFHRKQKITSTHKVVKLETRKSSEKDSKGTNKKCSLHPNIDLKLFCTACHQVACSECVVVLHHGHKCESIHKTIKVYSKQLNDSVSRVRSALYAKLLEVSLK